MICSYSQKYFDIPISAGSERLRMPGNVFFLFGGKFSNNNKESPCRLVADVRTGDDMWKEKNCVASKVACRQNVRTPRNRSLAAATVRTNLLHRLGVDLEAPYYYLDDMVNKVRKRER